LALRDLRSDARRAKPARQKALVDEFAEAAREGMLVAESVPARSFPEEPMALHACLECGNQVSDRAASCPNCGAPVGTGSAVPTRPSVEEWAISKLRAGSPRRSVVEEIVREGGMLGPDADALVKRLESALVPERPAHLVKAATGIGVAVVVLLLFFVVMRLVV